MDPQHKLWNERLQKLHRALSAGDHKKAIDLFMVQHAMVHSAGMSKSKLW